MIKTSPLGEKTLFADTNKPKQQLPPAGALNFGGITLNVPS